MITEIFFGEEYTLVDMIETLTNLLIQAKKETNYMPLIFDDIEKEMEHVDDCEFINKIVGHVSKHYNDNCQSFLLENNIIDHKEEEVLNKKREKYYKKAKKILMDFRREYPEETNISNKKAIYNKLYYIANKLNKSIDELKEEVI